MQTWVQTIASSQVDGPTLTAAAAATALPGQARPTMPGQTLQFIGQQMRLWASGRVSTVITSPGTIRFDLRFGGTVVFDTQAILPDTLAAYTNVGWVLDVLLTVRAVGGSANLMGQGDFRSTDILGTPQTPPKGGLIAIVPWNTAPVVGGNFDSTIAQQVDFFFTQTVATGSLTVHQFQLQLCQ